MPQFSEFSLAAKKPDAYNAYAAGPKRYGLAGRSAPNVGPAGASALAGYRARDAKLEAKKQAYLQYMQAIQGGNYLSANFLRGQ